MAPTVEADLVIRLIIASWALLVGVFDAIKRRIPNNLSVGMAALALIYLALTGQVALGGNWLSALLGVGLALLLTLPGYVTNKLGAGDVKFLLVCGMLGGSTTVGVSFIAAGFLTIALLLIWAALPHLALAYPLKQQKLPFGSALAIGLLLVVGGGLHG
jgi:prepilin peptidase CpaA